MTYARENGSVVFTQDMDFSSILMVTGGTKPSVVQLRYYGLSPETMGDRTIVAIRQMTSELATGALLTIDLHRIRLRLLPISSSGDNAVV